MSHFYSFWTLIGLEAALLTLPDKLYGGWKERSKPKPNSMSKTRGNSAFQGVSAMLGDAVIIRRVRGQYVVSRPARRPRKPTARQVERRELFREAAQYARRQISTEESYALYASGITSNKHTAYLVALSDCLNAPKVQHVDTLGYRGAVGDTIHVKATDDFMVTKVRIVITDPAGSLIEQGEAASVAGTADGWEYKTTVSNSACDGTTIRVVAIDRPGNKGTAEVVVAQTVRSQVPVSSIPLPPLKHHDALQRTLTRWMSRNKVLSSLLRFAQGVPA